MLNTINKFGQVSEDAVDSCDIKYLRRVRIVNSNDWCSLGLT